MAGLVTKLNRVLKANLDHYQSGLDHIEHSDRVTGFIVSSEFRTLDHRARQKLLATILKRELNDAERTRIGPIVTMTPDEADIGKRAA